mmetsp:Transcript_106508/g.332161  ORF Transcript_106508/g.332161 Transcript_106508/m.332161 type:complete len:218 (+) Transcript_106508:2-655(+)
MPRLARRCMFFFYLINLAAQLQPSLDWHPFFKFNHFASGNQPCTNPVLLTRSGLDKLVAARMAAPQLPFAPGFSSSIGTLAVRWFLELNYKPSAALVDCAFQLAGGNATDYAVVFADALATGVAGGESGSMNNYNLHLFRALSKLGVLDFGEAVLVWMEPVAWPQLPLGRQAMTWSIWDAKDGLLLSGELTSLELRSIRMPSHAAEFLPAACRGAGG